MEYLKNGCSTNIFLLEKDKLHLIQTYLEIKGDAYHQNSHDPFIKEFHYFFGNSVVFLKESSMKFNIKILAKNQDILEIRKKGIEEILNTS